MQKRDHDYMRRWEKLYEWVEQDEVYCIFQKEYEKFRDRLEKIGKFLPQRLMQTLYGYMDYKAMMEQRVLSVACMCMEFTGEEPVWYQECKKERVIEFRPERK